MRSLHLPFVALLAVGCAGDAVGDAEDEPFLADGKADAFGVAERTPEALAVLRFVNDADAAVLGELGITTRAQTALLERRAGADGVLGTYDDRELTSLARLDAVPWIGPLTFEALFEAATERGYVEPFGLDLAAAPRLIAIGDVHGDLDALRRALRLGGATDASDRWRGGDLVVVQAGDVLDREDGEREILELLARLDLEARAEGGRVIQLLGNHELMNAQGDFRYVTPAGFTAYAGVAPADPDDPRIRAFPAAQRGRAAAFLQGGPVARRLARHDAVARIGDTLFVHGGLTRSHVTYGLERIDFELRAFLLWDDLATPAILDADDGPLWLRSQGEPETTDCAVVARVLEAAGASRLVIAHSVQAEGITSACEDALWRIDVGMSSAYGGPVEILEILASRQVRSIAE